MNKYNEVVDADKTPLLRRTINNLQDFSSEYSVGMFNPASLPEAVLPILDFIDDERPNIVIACDRG